MSADLFHQWHRGSFIIINSPAMDPSPLGPRDYLDEYLWLGAEVFYDCNEDYRAIETVIRKSVIKVQYQALVSQSPKWLDESINTTQGIEKMQVNMTQSILPLPHDVIRSARQEGRRKLDYINPPRLPVLPEPYGHLSLMVGVYIIIIY